MKDLGLFRERSVHFRSEEAGATAIKYSLIATGIGLAVFGAVKLLGSSVNTIFASVATQIR